ncbi:RluA family pseudouridine synthase [Ruminococcaceae bacterium OttesenSCG-928-O06]|nr:RluA family pseudouridine synthase [Ruminococcaceae bacterium OttesenSCG-928-O06]
MKQFIFTGPGTLRLDRFILQQVPALAPGALHKYLRENKIKLNGKKAPLNTRLQPGDEVRLYLPTPSEGAAPAAPPFPRNWILYEDDELLALYKPPGLISQGGTPGTDSLLARARTHLAANGGAASSTFAPVLCHRLDTGTSGVILVAKTARMEEYTTGLLRRRQLVKTYLGLAVGQLAPPAGELHGWLLKNEARAEVQVLPHKAPGAKAAHTSYETLAVSGRLSLLRLCPHTGRTHQLRAQLAAAGTPLLGDSKYGQNAINRALRCRYQCLCALELRFPETDDAAFAPYSGLCIACPPPWFYHQALAGTLR